jgi:hypothetical protein
MINDLSKYKMVTMALILLMLIAGCKRADPTEPSKGTFVDASTTEPTMIPPTRTPLPVDVTSEPSSPFALISRDSLYTYVENLTAIQPYSGWRNSATEGEAEAMDYVNGVLQEFAYLQDLGLEVERQGFKVFMATELWETRLYLTVNGQEVEVPADGLRGPRDDITQALRFDSDGKLNDSTPDPVQVEGDVVLVRDASEIDALSPADLKGKVVILDYAVVDRVLLGGTPKAVEVAWKLLEKGPHGLVVVTQFSNELWESHGTFVSDVSGLNWVETEPPTPILYTRLEDLGPAGIETWEDLEGIETVRFIWDADVFSPGSSGNLIARIPGLDTSKAVILGAHIDSPNSPGALDDGSGCAVLMEVARVLNEARTQPPVDLYLAWFGSEEIGLYGSAYFANSHQELLDRTMALMQIDNLTRPLDGIDADLRLVTWSYNGVGEDDLAWSNYLSQASGRRGILIIPEDILEFYSDNNMFNGFGVPNADLIYENPEVMEKSGGLHYSGHVHDPYDTIELVEEMGEVFEEMANVALIVAIEAGRDAPSLRVAPEPDQRLVIVGSHNEIGQMTPAVFTEFGMALSLEGFDVDMIPYRQEVTPEDLENADLVIVLPVMDYPSPYNDPDQYDEAWTQAEMDALETYVSEGGLMVLTNSASRIKFWVEDPNEDWDDVNALATRFGITYNQGRVSSYRANSKTSHPLMEGVTDIALYEENSVPFTLEQGEVLAQAEGQNVVALVDYGSGGGQVLVLGDVGILGSIPESYNLPFWLNLARYARSR